jgi:hypothetical protein
MTACVVRTLRNIVPVCRLCHPAKGIGRPSGPVQPVGRSMSFHRNRRVAGRLVLYRRHGQKIKCHLWRRECSPSVNFNPLKGEVTQKAKVDRASRIAPPANPEPVSDGPDLKPYH